ncbi:MAG: hypothetical protein KH373_07100 [Ruminococcus sp.]|nr:hypothetical protein [Ruminococcus sp.]
MKLPFDINNLGEITKQFGNITGDDVTNLNWKLVGYDKDGKEKMKLDVPIEQILDIVMKNKDLFNK